MLLSKRAKKASFLLGTISVIIIIFAGVVLSGMMKTTVAKKTYPEEHLFVDATFLLKTDETNDSVNITCDIYLTNIWDKGSGEIKATAYVIETGNNFAIYKNTDEIGVIGADSTAVIQIPVVLSNNSYKVEVLLFENDKLVIKGGLTISAYPIYHWREIERNGQIEKLQVLEGWNVKNTYTDFIQIR